MLSLSSISLRYRSQLAFFKLKLVRWGLGLILRFSCKLLRIGRWSEPRFVFVSQLVEVIREADANETSGEDGVALPCSLVYTVDIPPPRVPVEVMAYAEGITIKSTHTRMSAEIHTTIHI